MNVLGFSLFILSYTLQYINAKYLLDNNNNNEKYYNIALTNIIILSITTFFTLILLILLTFVDTLTQTVINIIFLHIVFITICNILSCTTSIILITENIKDLSKIIPAIIYLSIVCIILLQKIINPKFPLLANFNPYWK